MATNNSINLPGISSGTPLATAFIQTVTASNSANLNFPLSSSYFMYLLVLTDIVEQTTNQKLNLLFSVDGGATYLGSSQYSQVAVQTAQDGGPTRYGGGSQSSLSLTEDVGVDSSGGFGLEGQIWIYNPGVAKRCVVQHNCNWLGTNAGTRRFAQGWGDTQSNTGINYGKIEFASGNIVSGTIDIYGYSN